MCYNIPMDRDLVKILGFNVDSFTFDEAVDYASENHGQIITINPEMISTAQSMPDFANVIHNAELVVPDGIGVELGLKILGHKVHRIAGVELGRALLEQYSKNNKTVAMVGAKPEVIQLAVQNLKNEIPNLNIVYSHDGYFSEDSEISDSIISVNPDLIFSCTWLPKTRIFY